MRRGLAAAWAVARNDLALLRAQPLPAVLTILVPVNFLILFVLFALGGGIVPVAVHVADRGPAASAMVAAMRDASTFDVQPAGSAGAAAAAMRRHDAVAAIVVPSRFSRTLRDGGTAALQLTLDNLNNDFAADVRRGLPLAITQFYRAGGGGPLPFTWRTVDTYPRTVGFLAFLALSIQTVALLLGGLLQGGLAMAGEWERGTVKELMLAPVPAWSVVLGKLVAALAGGMAGALAVLAGLLLLGVRPQSASFFGVMVLTLIVFASLGLAAGAWLRSHRAVLPFAFGLGLPLFFISGPFGPISWGTRAAAAIARVFPVVYANAAFQRAAFGYWAIDASGATVWGVLALWTVAALVVGGLLYRRATATR